MLERHLGVEINNRGNDFEIIGIPMSVDKATQILQQLYKEAADKEIEKHDVSLLLKSMDQNFEHSEEKGTKKLAEATLHLKEATIRPRTRNQQHYLKAMQDFDINFGIGPSGTGKTFLAVACAVAALEKEHVSRIVLVRPAVEAGESLGFLPGDLAQKVDPYLRPLYDALYEMLGVTKITKLISKGVIEIAPLAYMRGRTLNDSFIILDEGQNTTADQMRMFLTRIGFGSKAVITGDITQVDLPKNVLSGLRHAITLLRNIDAIRLTFFTAEDVVRHPLVQRIIEAYEKQDNPNDAQSRYSK
ncbi:MAG: PhoH family protein [Coxiellaceae bacterium]|nr:PhoH family protein [Coxiellaceae bacterium]